MGKGSNASKIARARELASKRAAEEKKGGGGAAGRAERLGAGGLSLQCAICKSPFLSTMSEAQLRMHQEAKHAKDSFETCFPTYGK